MHHRLKTNRTTKKDAALWVKGKMGLEVHDKTIQNAYRKRSQKGESATEN